MARTICVLSMEELEGWTVRKVKPDCSDHKHVTRLEAVEMTTPGNGSPYFRAIAEWVGPRHIRMLTAYAWRAVTTESGHTVLNLVEEGAARIRNRSSR
jgi:hypothetical protein